METEQEAKLNETFCRVLEQLAFMFAEPAAKDELPPPAEEDAMCVRMGFSGSLEGTLQLGIPLGICAELATNMLGMDLGHDEAAAKGLDAMKEVLNVTCGNILTELAGTEPVFTLSIPEATPLTAEAWEEFCGREDTLGYLVDETPVLLQFQIERPGA